ncbi:acyltransferase family protein [Promicromonospora thailandica]|uniref:Peptidoglycan/LPS O-acetylase OafA/YrhL, contains acyltransferase and SGNH-hydrolase domains n=1 Tax=Promicromonospora thailandica TaxID=765201 RepID=A0A9X2G8N8_9MICO|nr:acyltransferase family protein [Promicromonospora thailandica]MCP2264671.1 Peptidoglycan/LPS O-acetylase OafA/YrhL, contains acyltransferase and SGNH-hydrolase domains [Promicromonospora thailandica]BFF20252.1 acyltransferase family protein [Promicromonospora thailandica]
MAQATTPAVDRSGPAPEPRSPGRDAGPGQGSGHSFRTDINGLRAVAVLAVVVYHAGIAVPGGFTGVDVFYVISGYLISSLLLREVDRTGTVDLVAFWTRRMRRLVPALALVVMVTLLACLVLLSPLVWGRLAAHGAAAMLFVSNLLFPYQGQDYFSESATPSPYLHTWSLGIEEQFYLFWPLLVLLAVAVARRSNLPALRTLRLLFGGTFVVSLAFSAWLTATAPDWAFYVLPTRAWEFAGAALVATLPWDRLARAVPLRPWVLRTLLGTAGIALLALSFAVVRETDPFPGTVALLPVGGALLVLAAGSVPASGTWVDRVLGLPLLQRFGDVSYSWYLWHWPFVVLTTAAVQDDAVWIKVLASVAALGAAVATYRWVENPVRFSRALRSWRRTAAVTLAIGIVVGGFAAGTRVATAEVLQHEPYATAAATRAEPSSYGCAATSRTASDIELCLLGDVDASSTVLLLGDSHAMQWIPAFDAAAQDAGLRLAVRWRHGCPAAEVGVVQPTDRGPCDDFQAESLRLVEDLRPDAVVVSQAQIYGGRMQRPDGSRVHDQEALDAWTTANDELFARLTALTPNVVAVQDNPKLDLDPLECLTRPWPGLGDCSMSRAEAERSNGELPRISAEIWAAYGVTVWDGVWSETCDDTRCRVGDVQHPVYRDYHHLSADYVLSQVRSVERMLTDAVRGTSSNIR